MGCSMFSELERNIITMALMYLKNDYTSHDLSDLGLDYVEMADGNEFEKICQILIEDFIGPTWDEETTAKNIKTETDKRSRDDNGTPPKLFPSD